MAANIMVGENNTVKVAITDTAVELADDAHMAGINERFNASASLIVLRVDGRIQRGPCLVIMAKNEKFPWMNDWHCKM